MRRRWHRRLDDSHGQYLVKINCVTARSALTRTMLHRRLPLLFPLICLLTVALADEKPCTIHHGDDFFDLNKLSARFVVRGTTGIHVAKEC
jgi:hypothetical protein